MASDSEKYDVQLTCRSCLSKSTEMVPLLSFEDETEDAEPRQRKTIGEMMMECADVQIKSDDGLPQKVCRGCVSQLQAAIVYRKQCKSSELRLREYFENNLCVGDTKIVSEPEVHVEEMREEEDWIKEETASLHLWDCDSDNDQQMPNDDNENECVDGEHSSAEEKNIEYKALDTQPNAMGAIEDKANRINFTSRESGDAEERGLSVIDNLVDVDEHSRIVARAKRLNGKWECEICKKFLSSRQRLTMHVRSHLGNKSERCKIRDKSFITKSELTKHMNTHGGSKEATVYTCDICQRSCSTKNGIFLHLRSHRTTKGEGIISNRSNFVDPTDPAKQLCPYCGKSMKHSHLVVHIRRHTGEKPYACDLCDKAFPRSTDLKTHRLVHTGEQPFKCSHCDKAFSRSDRLRRHLRIHTNEKPYPCSHCDRAFTQSSDLIMHVRRHTGEKPFGCGVCGERFYLNTLLNTHCRTFGHFEAEALLPKLTTRSVNNV